MEKLSYAKCSKNQVPDEYSDNVQWEMSLRKGQTGKNAPAALKDRKPSEPDRFQSW